MKPKPAPATPAATPLREANQQRVDAAAQRVRQAMDYRKYLPDDPFRKDVELLIEIALAPVLEIFAVAAATPMAAPISAKEANQLEMAVYAKFNKLAAQEIIGFLREHWNERALEPAPAQPQRESEPRQCSCPIERCEGPKSANEYCTAHPPKEFERESEQPEQALREAVRRILSYTAEFVSGLCSHGSVNANTLRTLIANDEWLDRQLQRDGE